MQTLGQMLYSMLLQFELSRKEMTNEDAEEFAKGWAEALRALDRAQKEADNVSLFYRD